MAHKTEEYIKKLKMKSIIIQIKALAKIDSTSATADNTGRDVISVFSRRGRGQKKMLKINMKNIILFEKPLAAGIINVTKHIFVVLTSILKCNC